MLHCIIEEYNLTQSESLEDKNYLDELKFLYLTSILYPNMYHPQKNIGNFVHYNIVDLLAYLVKYQRSQSVFKIQKRVISLLQKMMTVDKYNVNLMTFTKMMTINDFHNMKSFSSSEYDLQHQANNFSSCLEKVWTWSKFL